MLTLIPAILSHNKDDFMAKLSASERNFREAQVDFMDGVFVPNKSVTLDDLRGLETSLQLEAHLMVEEPLVWIDGLCEIGFRKVLVHVEVDEDLEEVLKKSKELGMEVGLVINPDSDVFKLDKWLDLVGTVQVMGVHPGHYGANFQIEAVEKVRYLKEKGFVGVVQVDGAVTPETVPSLVEAGVDKLVVGHYFFGSEDEPTLDKIGERLERLEVALGKA